MHAPLCTDGGRAEIIRTISRSNHDTTNTRRHRHMQRHTFV